MDLHKVVPDVVDSFTKQFALDISYGSHHVSQGNELNPTSAAHRPTVNYQGKEDYLYTLAMVDPDAPSRENPKVREWRHWVVVNIPGKDVSQGDVLSSYAPPTPPKGTGLHRYVFVLYEQQDTLNIDPLDDNARGKWRLREFAKKHHIGTPVALNFFLAQKH